MNTENNYYPEETNPGVFPDPPANIGDAIKNKFKIKTARLFAETITRGSYPISNNQFNRVCRAFNIKTN